MIGRNISFIYGQHDQEVDLAVWHHKNRNGVVFENARLHESMKREVMAFIFDKSDMAEKLAARAELDLNLRGGLALTAAGPIVYLLWWVPPVDAVGVPFVVYEQLLDPMHEGTRNMLRSVAHLKYLHLALVGAGPRVLAMHEFLNEFGFGEIYALAQAASEAWTRPYDFDDAYEAYVKLFDTNGLLRGEYEQLTHAVGSVPVAATKAGKCPRRLL